MFVHEAHCLAMAYHSGQLAFAVSSFFASYRGMMRKMKKQQTQAVPNGMPLQGNELHVQTSTSSNPNFSMGAETFSNLDTFSNVSSGVSSAKNLDMSDFDWQGQTGSHFQG
tara:strand:- start:26 stop:358 length:333 start_codon:yes stop_codon:yes gene_type:complete